MSLIVWINGAFGAGKTTIAEKLAARWPQALVYDPEMVGDMLWQLLPRELLPDDFQDMPIWRRLVRTTALELVAEYGRPLIVPMTVVAPDYFDEILGGLRRSGAADVVHFTLLATEETLRARLAAREEGGAWAVAQLPRCIPALENDLFTEHVWTDGRSADEVADEIWRQLRVER